MCWKTWSYAISFNPFPISCFFFYSLSLLWNYRGPVHKSFKFPELLILCLTYNFNGRIKRLKKPLRLSEWKLWMKRKRSEIVKRGNTFFIKENTSFIKGNSRLPFNVEIICMFIPVSSFISSIFSNYHLSGINLFVRTHLNLSEFQVQILIHWGLGKPAKHKFQWVNVNSGGNVLHCVIVLV